MEGNFADVRCPGCGAPAHFDIIKQHYLCGYCGGTVGIKEAQTQKKGFRRLRRAKIKESAGQYSLMQASCSGCGATLVFPEGEAMTDCAFCGRALVRTQYLASSARKVTAVEIDRMLIPILADTLSGWDNVTVLNADILKTDIKALADAENEGRPIKIAANLPYYITTPILMALFESGAPTESITVMVQKEVAERMVTGPGSKAYGALSLAVQYYTDAEIAFLVPPVSFMPPPKVESAIVTMVRHEKPPVDADPEMLFKVIRGSFNERRKTLVNGLANFPDLGKTKAEIAAAIEACGFAPTVRGEQLSLAEFAKLAKALGGASQE